MSVSDSSFRPPQQLTASVPATISSIAVIDNAVAHLEALSIPSNSQVPALAAHIQAAKDHGRLWMAITRGEVVGALSGIVTWSVSFKSQLSELVRLARAIAQGDQGSVASFNERLGQLQQQTQQQQQQTQSVHPTVQSFIDAVDADARNFTQDENALKKLLDTEQQSVNQLRQEVNSLQQQLREKQDEANALGIFAPLYWAIMKLIDSLTGQLHSTQRELDQAEAQLQQAQQQQQQAAATKAVLDQYQQMTGSLSTGITALSSGWDTLNANLKELRDGEDIQDIQDLGSFGPDTVNAILLDWNNLAQQVQQLLAGTGKAFRIMHRKTGQYITMDPSDAGKASLKSTDDSNQLFILEKAGENDYRLRNVRYNVYLTYFANWKYLGGYSSTGYQDQHWGMNDAGGNNGIQLFNRWTGFSGNNHLFFNGTNFGLYFGDYDDQQWLLQYETWS